jgi:hypothetical protein
MALVHFVLHEWVWFSLFRTGGSDSLLRKDGPGGVECRILASQGREIVRQRWARSPKLATPGRAAAGQLISLKDFCSFRKNTTAS